VCLALAVAASKNQRNRQTRHSTLTFESVTTILRKKTMNTIRFSFEDLCAFFSRYPSRLMVMIGEEES
jgi:hypothetical protein